MQDGGEIGETTLISEQLGMPFFCFRWAVTSLLGFEKD